MSDKLRSLNVAGVSNDLLHDHLEHQQLVDFMDRNFIKCFGGYLIQDLKSYDTSISCIQNLIPIPISSLKRN
jgi:hypothetical protein